MAFIYDLDNEYGGYIIADDNSKQSALQVNNLSAHPAIAVYSTASGRPLDISVISAGVKVEGKSGAGQPALEVESYEASKPPIAVYSTASASPIHTTALYKSALIQSAVTNTSAVTFGKTVLGNETNAPVVFANLSQASVPIIDFGNNYISVASIAFDSDKLGTAQKWIVVRAGAVNYGMPLFSLSTAVNGPGAY